MTPEFNPHEILGVTHDAGPAELKRAFRRLAMRWHPDRNDHPEATERFKAIRAAYDHLAAVDDEETPEFEAPDDSPTEPARKAPDIRLNLDLTLEEAAAGCTRQVDYSRGKLCETCEGSGESGMAKTRFCGACHGSGRVRNGKRGLASCQECRGRGFFTERICPDCSGSGRKTTQVSLQIAVPPGMLAGDELRLAGQGEVGDETLADGDFYLTVVLRYHALFRLEGRDLHVEMPASALALLAGGEIELPLLGGWFCHVLTPGQAMPRLLRLEGRGYPGRGKLPPGDLIVRLMPVFPSKLNARQRKLLLQANQALMDDLTYSLPEIAQWQQAFGQWNAQN